MTLSGLEVAVKHAAKRDHKVNVVAYADDFIITGASREVLETVVKPTVEAFLKERGLELSQEKTRITPIDDGFDFVGFNVRKYGGKLLIKPARESIKSFLADIRALIKRNVSSTTVALIRQLNRKIRGWTNYYRHGVAKRSFRRVENQLFLALIGWINRRHLNKSRTWKRRRYFRSHAMRDWVFFARAQTEAGKVTYLDLFSASSVSITRHIKIQGKATPYDPAYRDYFARRATARCVSHLDWRGRVAFN